jgi:peptidoglycan hydrolase-like protein with peptidoglycan-binding domain
VTAGDALTTGYGVVGSQTRTKINMLLGGTTTNIQTVKTTPTAMTLTKTLYIGVKDTKKSAEVSLLQTFLINKGYLAKGNTSGFFGKLTKQAVQKYQCAVINLCSGTEITTGYGMVGKRTRMQISL